MKLSARSFANAAGVTAVILWTVCAFVAIVLPDLYQAGANLLSFGSVGHFNLDLISVILGGIVFTVIAWISGYLFGWNLDRFSKK